MIASTSPSGIINLIIDSKSTYLFEQVFLTGAIVKDLVFEKKITKPIQLEFELGHFLNDHKTNDLDFHIYLHAFCESINVGGKRSKIYYGIDVYHLICQELNIRNRARFFFYGFHSLDQLAQSNAAILPDLYLNNYVQLPIDPNGNLSSNKYKPYEAEALNLWRGKLLTGGELHFNEFTDKTILMIDDKYEELEEIYKNVFPGKLVGLKLKKEDYRDLDKVRKALMDLLNEIPKIDCLISDLYLSTEHNQEFVSNPMNARDISGFKVYNEVIKSVPLLSNIPIIFLSTSSRIWNYEIMKDEPNFSGWVVKPSFSYSESRIEEIKYCYKSLYHLLQKAIL